mmetsp:Transcript_27375/g.74853  ORF Transcript_27375/g.74853 Transcript_27375/m.74853 type:complete len:192 (-) Transcript_27375:1608-2183(-)
MAANRQPFKFTREEWPEDAYKVKMSIGNARGGVAFSDYMKVLEGTERPELFIIWKRDFDRKIADNANLNGDQRIDILLRIVTNEALSIVQRALGRTHKQKDPKLKDHHDKLVQLRIAAATSNTLFLTPPTATTTNTTNEPEGGDADGNQPGERTGDPPDYFTTEEYKKDVLQECMYALKLQTFGNDAPGGA